MSGILSGSGGHSIDLSDEGAFNDVDLDSLDGNLEGANEHQLNEIKAAENKIHDNSLVLLDDKLSKCEHSIKYLKQKNYKVLFETDQQILFSKRDK